MALTTVTRADAARALAERCNGRQRQDGSWQCHCPAHEDTTASLSVKVAEDGKLLLHCHAGCDLQDVLSALGLMIPDLFPADQRPPTPTPVGCITDVYDYHTADGHLLFQTVRYTPKDFKQRRPDPAKPGKYLWNLQGIEPVLYRLPALLKALQALETVYLVEGEKDADNVHALGITATTAPMGAGKWRPSYTETLRGAHVVLLPDNDAPGRNHAQQVAQALHGIAADIKLLALPGLPEKGDITDWLHAGGTREALAALVAACPLWTPASPEHRPPTPGMARQIRATLLHTVMPEHVQFLWKPYLPLGRPVAVEGDPGVGKSGLIAKITAHLTSGKAFPNVLHGQAPQPFPPCNVCLFTAEDDPGDTILPRIVVNGGDPARVILVEGWQQADGAQGAITMQDLDLLTQALTQYTPRLLVFDPVQSFFGKGIDMNHASDTRPVLDAVVALCKRYTCTPLFVRHIGKARRDKALYAGLGSIDITAAMRSVLFLGQDPEHEQRRILAQSKANNARIGPSLAYRIVSVAHDLPTPAGELITVEAPRLDWDGLSPLTATDLASPPMTDEEDISAVDQAREFLRELLAEGAMLSEDVSTAAKKAGISMATIRRAKSLESIKVRRRRLDGGPSRAWPWEWYVTDTQSTCASPSIHTDEHLEHLEHLLKESNTYEHTSRYSSDYLGEGMQRTDNQMLTLDVLDAHLETVVQTATTDTHPIVSEHPNSLAENDYDEGVI